MIKVSNTEGEATDKCRAGLVALSCLLDLTNQQRENQILRFNYKGT